MVGFCVRVIYTKSKISDILAKMKIVLSGRKVLKLVLKTSDFWLRERE